MRAVTFFLVAGLACVSSSSAWSSPYQRDIPLTVINERATYDSMDEAAIAALVAISRPFSKYEFGGMIVERDGRFYFTVAVSSHSVDSVTFRMLKEPEENVVAVYHTHPIPETMTYDNASYAMRFSPADAEYVRASGYVSYIADSRTRTVRRLEPETLPFNLKFYKGGFWGKAIAKLPWEDRLIVAAETELPVAPSGSADRGSTSGRMAIGPLVLRQKGEGVGATCIRSSVRPVDVITGQCRI